MAQEVKKVTVLKVKAVDPRATINLGGGVKVTGTKEFFVSDDEQTADAIAANLIKKTGKVEKEIKQHQPSEATLKAQHEVLKKREAEKKKAEAEKKKAK